MTSRLRRGRRSGSLWALLVGLCALVLGRQAMAAPEAPSAQAGPRAYLRVELPRHKAYVGEVVPVTVRAYYRGDTSVSVTGAPALGNTDFTLTESDPAQGRAEIGGVPYLVVTWKGKLSPVKAGHYALSMTLPSTLKWQDIVQGRTNTLDAPGDEPSQDPFDGFFGSSIGSGQDLMQQMQRRMQQMMRQAESGFDVGAMQQKDVVLRSSDLALDVAPLPAEGRPPGFSGAVGHFELSASAQPTKLRAGEPASLELRVTGKGSFDRVQIPGVADSADWRAYPPNARQVDDGTKVFTQPVVPSRSGVGPIPSVALSYFDPDAARYVTLRTAPVPVDVAPGQSIATSSTGVAPSIPSGPSLAPDELAQGEPVSGLAPIFERRGFWMAQSIPFLGLGAAFGAVFARRRRAADADRPWRREGDRALRRLCGEMDRAVDQGDAAAFFAAARGAFQQRLGARWHLRPEAITLAEIAGRLDTVRAEPIRQVFDLDASRFSGMGAAQADLAAWKDRVGRELHQLKETMA